MTTDVIRRNAADAGVRFWIDDAVPVYANERPAAIHVKDGGKKTVRLPRRAVRATELYSGRVACENADSFDWKFRSPDTVLFEIEYAEAGETF